jgi:hypothetical protein
MPRGRPKKIQPPVVEETSTQWLIAVVLAKHCTIPGCGPKLHLEEASEVLEIINKRSK